MDRGMSVVVMVMVMAAVEVMVPVAAQAAPQASPSPSIQPVTCSLPSTLMISTNYCNSYDEQGMGTQTKSCQGFLTMAEASPSVDCCRGLNSVAYNRTACICKLTFYPPASNNASRQLDLPRLCGVQTDLCAQCPIFLTSISNANGTNTPPVSNAPYSEGQSTASTVGAISLAVVFGLLLLGGIVFGVLFLIKKHKAKNNPPENFEAPPPGGAF
ncbi:hypothetical protein KC19_5G044700 [Ceratodon purpureus]|uniref:Bifunctional inhibitor/plant lipid transfer protein/seed storage helical domain-containing protein n=1 Tax=Ceratodon purpureus TaxID=3225 RepID=A0A8T0HXV6_CERPU|nr:hypothetical protein KC19_5G044700 [Ceratodon purpureus]